MIGHKYKRKHRIGFGLHKKHTKACQQSTSPRPVPCSLDSSHNISSDGEFQKFALMTDIKWTEKKRNLKVAGCLSL